MDETNGMTSKPNTILVTYRWFFSQQTEWKIDHDIYQSSEKISMQAGGRLRSSNSEIHSRYAIYLLGRLSLPSEFFTAFKRLLNVYTIRYIFRIANLHTLKFQFTHQYIQLSKFLIVPLLMCFPH